MKTSNVRSPSPILPEVKKEHNYAHTVAKSANSHKMKMQNPYSQTSPQPFMGGGMSAMKASPFRVPNDEEVFLQREAEKIKLQELKQLTRGQKIWEKTTANTRSPLKRVTDQDIQPAEINDHTLTYNYNSQQRGYISAAMNIAKSRVTFSLEPLALPGGKNKQDINDFIT